MSHVDIGHNTNTLRLSLRLHHGAVSQQMEHTTSHLNLKPIKEPSDFIEAFIHIYKMIPNPNSIIQNQQSKANQKANFFLDSEEMWKLQKETFFYWSCTNILLLLVVTYITRDKLVERTERAVWGVHLSHVNTQISPSLTKVMVGGVSLNNPAVDACDSESSTLKRTTSEGKLGGPHLSCSVQYFNAFSTTVKRIIKQQGQGACRSVAAFRPLLPLRGRGENMHEQSSESKESLQTFCVLTSDKMDKCDSRKPWRPADFTTEAKTAKSAQGRGNQTAHEEP